MAEQWDDLYFRHNFLDTGLYPTSGNSSASPDVIPLGASIVSDPLDLIADANWMRDYGNSTDASAPNYIYLRGRNLSSSDTVGELHLYYSLDNLLLWPQLWSKNALKTSSGRPSVTVQPKAGARFVTSDPFRWIPEPVNTGRYSLISRVVTAKHPNPIPTVDTLPDFARYIAEHPNMGWRSVVTINPNHQVVSSTVNYYQGREAYEVYIILRCLNVPDGSRVAFSSATPGPDPLINASGVVRNQQTSQGPSYSLALLTRIPAEWTSDIAFTWYSEGKVPLPGMTISLDAIIPIPTDHADPVLAAAAQPLTGFGIHEHAIPADGPQSGILLGSSRMETLPVAV